MNKSQTSTIIKSDKFYRVIKDTTVQVSRNTAGGGYESFPLNISVGCVFKGQEPHTKTNVYDGMPVSETTHIVAVQGVDLSKTNNDYSMRADATGFSSDSISEISEEEYVALSNDFSKREPYRTKPGAFKNFLFNIG